MRQTGLYFVKMSDSMMNNVPAQSSEWDSVWNILGLSPTKVPMDSFGAMWYHVFVWGLFSSLFVHLLAASVAVLALRKHGLGRWLPILILAMGIIAPLTGGVITSAVIAYVYKASNFVMDPKYALIWGTGQTALAVVMSYTRILATL